MAETLVGYRLSGEAVFNILAARAGKYDKYFMAVKALEDITECVWPLFKFWGDEVLFGVPLKAADEHLVSGQLEVGSNFLALIGWERIKLLGVDPVRQNMNGFSDEFFEIREIY